MLEFFGYTVIFLSIIASIFIVVETHNYLIAFICFWVCLTIGSMLIVGFKEDEGP